MKKLFIIPILFLFSCQRDITYNVHPDFKSLSPREGQMFDVVTNSKYLGDITLYTNCKEETYASYNKNDYPIPVNTCYCTDTAGVYKMYEGVIIVDNNKVKDFIEVTILSKTEIQGDFIPCFVTYNLQIDKKSENKKPVLVAGS